MGMVTGSSATRVQNLGEIQGVVVFHLDICLASIGQYMGCIAKYRVEVYLFIYLFIY